VSVGVKGVWRLKLIGRGLSELLDSQLYGDIWWQLWISFVCDLSHCLSCQGHSFCIRHTVLYNESLHQEAYMYTTRPHVRACSLVPSSPGFILRPIKFSFTTLINPNFQTSPNLIPYNNPPTISSFLNSTQNSFFLTPSLIRSDFR